MRSPLIMFVCSYVLLSSNDIHVTLFNRRVNYFTGVAARPQSSPSPDNVVTYESRNREIKVTTVRRLYLFLRGVCVMIVCFSGDNVGKSFCSSQKIHYSYNLQTNKLVRTAHLSGVLNNLYCLGI